MATYNFIDLAGKKFGRLTVISRAPNVKGKTMWNCKCSCGSEKAVRASHLSGGRSTSCGCRTIEATTKHGESKRNARSPEYSAWLALKDRCNNPVHPSYKDYGGRGITVCQRWQDSFTAFLEDMGRRPAQNLSIDRMDNNGPYSPDNCRWADIYTQLDNRRNSRLYTINGETKCLKHWCQEYGKNYGTARYHAKRGRPIEFILGIDS